jgi:hypothetical protein
MLLSHEGSKLGVAAIGALRRHADDHSRGTRHGRQVQGPMPLLGAEGLGVERVNVAVRRNGLHREARGRGAGGKQHSCPA